MVDVSGSRPRSLRPAYPVRGERLLLRPLARGDADTLLAYRSREDVCRYVPFEPMSRDDIIERIAGQWARTELTDEGQSLTLGAQVGETSELAGDVVLFWRSRAHAGGELGYVFNPALGRTRLRYRGCERDAAARLRGTWPASHRRADR
jgi:RimJ/RimL family protein N-acetyltransferase